MGDRRFFGGIIESGGQGRHRITQNSAFCVMLTKIVVLGRRSGTSFWDVVLGRRSGTSFCRSGASNDEHAPNLFAVVGHAAGQSNHP